MFVLQKERELIFHFPRLPTLSIYLPIIARPRPSSTHQASTKLQNTKQACTDLHPPSCSIYPSSLRLQSIIRSKAYPRIEFPPLRSRPPSCQRKLSSVLQLQPSSSTVVVLACASRCRPCPRQKWLSQRFVLWLLPLWRPLFSNHQRRAGTTNPFLRGTRCLHHCQRKLSNILH